MVEKLHQSFFKKLSNCVSRDLLIISCCCNFEAFSEFFLHWGLRIFFLAIWIEIGPIFEKSPSWIFFPAQTSLNWQSCKSCSRSLFYSKYLLCILKIQKQSFCIKYWKIITLINNDSIDRNAKLDSRRHSVQKTACLN